MRIPVHFGVTSRFQFLDRLPLLDIGDDTEIQVRTLIQDGLANGAAADAVRIATAFCKRHQILVNVELHA